MTRSSAAQGIACPSCGTPQLAAEAACASCGWVLATPAQEPAGSQTWFKRPPVIIPVAAVGCILFFVIVYVVIQAIVNPSRPAHQTASAAPDAATGGASSPVAAGAPAIQYSPRPAPAHIAFFDMYKVRISGSGPGYPVQLFVYLPAARQHAQHALPCVLIAPAGSRLFHGMSLAEGDIREHLPYVQGGFAVCAYDLAGVVVTIGDKVAYRDLEVPARLFAMADGGVANAEAAIDYIISQFPEIDPTHLYAAGHSSAANVALDVALADHRIKGVAAYAPATDLEARLGNTTSILNKLVPGEADFIARISPIRRVNDFACPVLLFHADDDTNIPAADSQNFSDAMTRAGKSIRFIKVPTGGHYQSMIDHGINAGIEFFKSLGAAPLPPTIQPTSSGFPAASN
jgi:dienelactone hydrolase